MNAADASLIHNLEGEQFFLPGQVDYAAIG
jgi:hypothetical protein